MSETRPRGSEISAAISAATPTSRSPLEPAALARLRTGAVRARGWLREQLLRAADGLTGHLGEVWPDVGPQSGWLGGDGESWERGPYYARGLVSLGHALGHERLIEMTRPWIDWTLASQRSDCLFGPAFNDDWWARMPMLEALRLHCEATGDERVVPFLSRYFLHQLENLPARPLADWARPRGGDNIDSVLWLYDRSGEPFLLELAGLLHAQTSDWVGELSGDGPPSDAFELAHGVNRAMGFKEPAAYFLLSGEDRLLDALRRGWLRTMEHHGQVHGLFSCDELLHGRGATQGTELCAIVELLSSFHFALRVTGEPWIADAIERICLNALPATISPDHRGHQYFQQANQVMCTPGGHGFGMHHQTDLLFGVATGFGCCAANYHLGWPQLVSHLWYATPAGGLAAMQLLPSVVETDVSGTPVSVVQETEYPFEEEACFVVHCRQPVAFPLSVRIPAWAAGAELALNDGPGVVVDTAADRVPPSPAGLAGADLAISPRLARPDEPRGGRLVTVSRTWRDGERLTLRLPMEVRLATSEGGAVTVERGPLVYALGIAEEWRQVGGEEPWADYELHPRSPWNYGLVLEEGAPARSLRVRRTAIPAQPWTPDGAPTWIEAVGRQIPAWTVENDSAGPIPGPPVATARESVPLRLIPYGCARLRISVFPALQ